jgi:hypothetical protein
MARETLSVLLDSSNAAGRPDAPCFAGVCPMASPDPAGAKIRVTGVAKRTAILSA